MRQIIRVVLSIGGLLAASGALVGQSRDELIRKCGEPISETFMVRPGIAVTATYASHGRIVELLISPRTTAQIKSRGNTLKQDTVRAIIDELVPLSAPGKSLSSGFANLSCLPENDCYGTTKSYENVAIYYNAGKDGSISYAVVSWKE